VGVLAVGTRATSNRVTVVTNNPTVTRNEPTNNRRTNNNQPISIKPPLSHKLTPKVPSTRLRRPAISRLPTERVVRLLPLDRALASRKDWTVFGLAVVGLAETN
jgi:hypothetical protein